MKKLIISLILTTTIVFTISCGNNGNTGDDGSYVVNGVSLSKKNRQLTTQGAVVYSNKQIDFTFLSNVDSGLTMAFNNGRLSGWSRNMEYPMYSVYIPVESCVPSPQQGVMSFKIRGNGGDYDGSVFDYDGMELETDPIRLAAGYVHKANGKILLYAAEQVTSMTENSMEMIVCPGPDAINANNNGVEHYLSASNDGDYYELTKYHLTISHPFLPKPLGLIQEKRTVSSTIANEVLTVLVK